MLTNFAQIFMYIHMCMCIYNIYFGLDMCVYWLYMNHLVCCNNFDELYSFSGD